MGYSSSGSRIFLSPVVEVSVEEGVAWAGGPHLVVGQDEVVVGAAFVAGLHSLEQPELKAEEVSGVSVYLLQAGPPFLYLEVKGETWKITF